MRTGTNPAKTGIPAYTPQELGVALIVYIPFTTGYFQNSLEILKYQIESLRATTPQKFDLLVFDNSSCPQAVAELQALQARKWVDWLILSQHNMGKAGAWNWIFAAMPNPLICYADSDVLFRPGWLAASLEVLGAFPRAGMVSAQPNFFDVMKGEGQAHRALLGDPAFELQDYWPAREIIDEYCLGIGASDEVAAPFYTQPLPSLQNKDQKAQAVLGASHMQFIIPRAVARQVTPLPATKGLLRAETMSLDYKIDSLGYLHLSTTRPYVFHMGNTVNARLIQELSAITGETHASEVHPEQLARRRSWLLKLLARLAGSPRFQPHMLRAYNLLFHALYDENRVK